MKFEKFRVAKERVVSESTRVVWTISMHRCTSVHNEMSIVTGLLHQTSLQHTGLGQGRIKRDNNDLDRFQLHDTFDTSQSSI